MMKSERVLRKKTAIRSGCADWHGNQEICVCGGPCACLREAREKLSVNQESGDAPGYNEYPARNSSLEIR